MSLGKRIKDLRTSRKMSQEELGKYIGVNRAAVNKYEKGTVTNIPIDSLLTICKLFSVTPNYLLLGEYSPNKNELQHELINLIGEDGVLCLNYLLKMSPEGKKHALQYLEDMNKIYNI